MHRVYVCALITLLLTPLYNFNKVYPQTLMTITGANNAPVAGTPGQFQYNNNSAFGGTNGLIYSTSDAIVSSGFSFTANGLSTTYTNPTMGNDINFRRAWDINAVVDNSNLNTNFSTYTTINNTRTALGPGQNDFDAVAKTSYFNSRLEAQDKAQGQHFLQSNTMYEYAMGDVYAHEMIVYAWGGTNAHGDEGQGIQRLVLQQAQSLVKATISSVPAASTCNTTLTQNITKSVNVQVVTVASSSGCNVNDRAVIDAGNMVGSKPRMEIVKVTAVATGTITGQFRENHSSGDTVQGAVALTLSTTGNMGAGRYLVNLTSAPYITGTVTSTAGTGFVGLGTTWTDTMVGGTALIPGCISLTNDDYSYTPFDASNPLKGWFGIASVVDNTHLNIAHFKEASHPASYVGNGVGAGAYTIRACARVLDISGATVYLEPNSFTWTVSDTVEQAISVDLTVPALVRAQLSVYNPNATVTAGVAVHNYGQTPIESGVSVDQGLTGDNTLAGYKSAFMANAHTTQAPFYAQGKSDVGRLIHAITFDGDNKDIFWVTSQSPVNLGVNYTSGDLIATLTTATAIFSVNRPIKFAGVNTTGSGTALLGSNSPAVTPTAPYTWIKAISSDGSTVYLPAWK